MELNDNEAAVCDADSTDAQPSTGIAVEVNLYDDLIAFADLAPEEQTRLAFGQADTLETQNAPSEVAETVYFSGPIGTPEASEPVEAETWPDQLGKQPATGAAEPTSPEAPAPIDDVDIEIPSADETDWNTGRDVQAHAFIEPAGSATTANLVETASDVEFSSVSGERDSAVATTAGPITSGPLSGFSLPPDIVYTGAMSRGVCLACGAESGTDDLFCIACGVFIDGIGSTLAAKITCVECKKEIGADDVFCPWCGAVLAAA